MALPILDYRLYVMLRSDLESMTPGKAAAQVAHAASQCAERCSALASYREWLQGPERKDLPREFINFGTTIVLDGGSFKDDGTDRVPDDVWNIAPQSFCGAVSDPSYPILDGKKTHHLPLRTCYWFFVDPDSDLRIRAYLDQFKLYTGNHD